MNLHYKKEFVEPLRNGAKKHTIRNYAIEPGTPLKHVINPYSADDRQIVLENTCTGNQTIEIIRVSDILSQTIVKVDGRKLLLEETQQLAYNDGFDNLIYFWMYFADGGAGYINHWTNIRY